jgi:hypothetical protein
MRIRNTTLLGRQPLLSKAANRVVSTVPKRIEWVRSPSFSSSASQQLKQNTEKVCLIVGLVTSTTARVIFVVVVEFPTSGSLPLSNLARNESKKLIGGIE